MSDAGFRGCYPADSWNEHRRSMECIDGHDFFPARRRLVGTEREVVAMPTARIKNGIKYLLPKAVVNPARRKYWHLIIEIDKLRSVFRFLRNTKTGVSFATRIGIVKTYYATSAHIDCPHTPGEILSYIETILTLPNSIPGCVVEAGCFKGGSTAKFSVAAKLAHRELVVFDSFEGIPENTEDHASTPHGSNFDKGAYAGSLDEVKANISRFGEIEACRFIKGWFEDTLPHFREPIAAIYLDVDLVSSTRTCLKYLYPLLEPHGLLYSQDGHLPLVCDLFDDEAFWEREVGAKQPVVEGLRESKLLRIVKQE
jgi:O-methyltransferase